MVVGAGTGHPQYIQTSGSQGTQKVHPPTRSHTRPSRSSTPTNPWLKYNVHDQKHALNSVERMYVLDHLAYTFMKLCDSKYR